MRYSSKTLTGVVTTLLAAGALTAAPALGAAADTGDAPETFYVSPNGRDTADGHTPGTAWRSLDRVNATELDPGDRVLFAAGGRWDGQLAPQGSGTAGAPITIGAFGTGAKPLIAGGGDVDAAIKISDQENVVVSGFEVTNKGAGTSPRIGIQVTARDHGEVENITVTGNYVHGIQGVDSGSNASNPSAGGIIVSALGQTTPTYYRNVTITGNEVADSRSYGIVTWSSWMQREGWNDLWDFMPVPADGYRPYVPSLGVKVSDNYVHDISAGGITVMQAAGALISHNRVDKTAQNHGNVGIWWADTDDILVEYNEVSGTKYWGLASDGNAFDADASAHDSIVQYNYSHDNEGGFFIAVSTGTAPAEAVIRYNVSQGDANEVFAFSTNARNIDVYNNTIWATETDFIDGHPDRAEFSLVKVWRDTVKNVKFRNNVIHNSANLPYRDSAAVTYDRNIYSTGPVPARDTTAIVADAGLTAPGAATGIDDLGGYKPRKDSPAIAAGLTVPRNGGADVIGTPLPSGMPDIGAVQRRAGEGRDEDAATAVASAANGQGTVPAAVADGSDLSPWASATDVTLPTTLDVTFPSRRKIAEIELSAIFGADQGVTTLDVQVPDGRGGWRTALSNAKVAWTGSSATLERHALKLPHPEHASAVRLVIRSANQTWGNIAVSEIGTISGR
ncbi:right-handed parallel beta-helix repeat-containing protein [Microbacterium sp. NPDC057659]|uniref:right-handed parallel beta-helix repeat-containing protein n=1 Tax=Microbacterium sp. NPDC057659 TaxID=3346198 RepID=UPI0036709790